MIQNIYNSCTKCILKGKYRFTLLLSASIHKRNPIEFRTTVVYWILQHFKGNPKYETHLIDYKTSGTYQELSNALKDKASLTAISMESLLTHCIEISRIGDVRDNSLIRNVDQELCKRLSVIDDYRDILRIADALLYFTHNAASKTKSFRLCIESINDTLREKDITLQHFIQCVFYTSILKKDTLSRDIMKVVLRKIYFQAEIINTITTVELAIFCNSVYKTGTEIRSKKIMRAIINAIESGADELFSSKELCTSILKPIHQSKYHDYIFLKNLSNVIMNKTFIDVDKYQLTNVTYLFKLYSNALYNDKKLTDYLLNVCVSKLNVMHKNAEYIRAKDISILLKSCCELGDDSMKQLIGDNIVPIIYDVVKNNLFQRNELLSLMEILLWLNIMDTTFLDDIIINNFITPQLIVKCNTTIKAVARMNLLLTILSIEKRLLPGKEEELLKLIEPTDGCNLDRLIYMRPKVYAIFKAMKCLSVMNKDIKDVTFNCQIPNLYMPGVTVEISTHKKIAIECLDEKVCLYNTEIPNGYMKLKSRLLKKMGYIELIIPQKVIDEGSISLYTTVEDRIAQVISAH